MLQFSASVMMRIIRKNHKGKGYHQRLNNTGLKRERERENFSTLISKIALAILQHDLPAAAENEQTKRLNNNNKGNRRRKKKKMLPLSMLFLWVTATAELAHSK